MKSLLGLSLLFTFSFIATACGDSKETPPITGPTAGGCSSPDCEAQCLDSSCTTTGSGGVAQEISDGAGASVARGGHESGSGGAVGTGGQPASCSDDLPDAGEGWETCSDWAEWGHCGDEWMVGKCNQSCQRCEVSSSGGSQGDGDGDGDQDDRYSEGNPYSPLSGGPQSYTTRYWDCCKPSCGWSDRPNTVDSCDSNGNNIGVNDQVMSSCNGGQAQTCHGMAPWAANDGLAYGFAAANGHACGSCYQLQFTGQGNSDPNEPGSVAIRNKTMIVMVTNTGGELGDGRFDLLIPGGGLGAFNGCSASIGIPAGDFGPAYGGFIADCASRSSHEAKKQCVRDRCTSVFGSRGLDDLEEGCLWSADWFEAADNPRFLYKEVQCPSQLQGFN